jgi:hypothetical protein
VLASIARLILAWRWQPRVAIIVGTLRRAVPDLAYYSLTAGVVLLMMTAWGHLLMGSIYQPFSTFSGTFHWVMLFFIAGECPCTRQRSWKVLGSSRDCILYSSLVHHSQHYQRGT